MSAYRPHRARRTVYPGVDGTAEARRGYAGVLAESEAADRVVLHGWIGDISAAAALGHHSAGFTNDPYAKRDPSDAMGVPAEIGRSSYHEVLPLTTLP